MLISPSLSHSSSPYTDGATPPPRAFCSQHQRESPDYGVVSAPIGRVNEDLISEALSRSVLPSSRFLDYSPYGTKYSRQCRITEEFTGARVWRAACLELFTHRKPHDKRGLRPVERLVRPVVNNPT